MGSLPQTCGQIGGTGGGRRSLADFTARSLARYVPFTCNQVIDSSPEHSGLVWVRFIKQQPLSSDRSPLQLIRRKLQWPFAAACVILLIIGVVGDLAAVGA